MALTDHETPRSPDWWLLRLGRKQRDRQKNLDLWRSYYLGEHPLPEGPRKAVEAYKQFQKRARTNFCEMVVKADVHRQRVIGINNANGDEDQQAWGWWQANKMDSKQKQLYRAALSQSLAYIIVGPHPKESTRPLITVEHPREVIVETDPATGERAAAAKIYYDDIDKVARATVYLDNVRYRYVTEKRGPLSPPMTSAAWTLVEAIEHTLGIPVVEFANPCDLGEEPRAAFAVAIDVQDRINMGVLDRMTAARYSAFRQKYVTGHKFSKITDPETGLQVIQQPFVPGPGNVWASEGESTKFGEFGATELTGYLKLHESDIRDFLVMTSTPAYYVASQIINIAADTVTALDANHNAKIAEEQDEWGEGFEEVFGLCGKVAGSEVDYSASEVRWADPRSLNPAIIADMGIKKKAIGYPLTMVAEDMGDSPQRIARLRSEAASDALLGVLAAPVPEAVTDGAV